MVVSANDSHVTVLVATNVQIQIPFKMTPDFTLRRGDTVYFLRDNFGAKNILHFR